MEFIKKLRNILCLFVIFGIVTAYVDYQNLNKGIAPVFSIKQYNEKTKIEKSRGIFYEVERTIKYNTNEAFNLSSNIKYSYLNKTISIKLSSPKQKYDFILLVTPSITCPSPSKLYFELEKRKIYLDCIASIRVKEKNVKESVELNEYLEKHKEAVDDIIDNLFYVELLEDRTTEKFRSIDDTFTNSPLVVYRCNNETKDIYITNNEKMEKDYCTVKNDSLKEEEKKEE